MISLEDLIGFCDLTPDEVQVVAEHEHVSPATAAVLGNYLLQSQSGCEQIRAMLMDEIRTAVRQHDVPHARQLVSMLRHFLHEHPNVAFRHAA
jgi:CII-binding regulator of phage lambda lysogenization HflD